MPSNKGLCFIILYILPVLCTNSLPNNLHPKKYALVVYYQRVLLCSDSVTVAFVSPQLHACFKRATNSDLWTFFGGSASSDQLIPCVLH